MRPFHRLVCRDFVEIVTDYLEGALDDREVRRVDRHLRRCGACRSVLAQWRTVVALNGRLRLDEVESLDPGVRAALLDAFQAARAGPP